MLFPTFPSRPKIPNEEPAYWKLQVWLCSLKLWDGVFLGRGSRTVSRHSLPPLCLIQAFSTVATLSPMRLLVFFTPFAVKGLTNSVSAADRFKVSGQRSDRAAPYSVFSWACSPMPLLLSVTPGQAESSPDGEGLTSSRIANPSDSVISCAQGGVGLGRQMSQASSQAPRTF